MKNKILIFLVPLVLASVMCVVPNLDTEYFAKTKPDSEKLVGKYLPTIETLKLIRDEGHYEVGANENISITLFSDGTFEMENMPDWWQTDFGRPKGGKDSGTGQWSVVKLQEWWQLELDFDSRENFSSETASSGLTTFIPIVDNPLPYALWFYVGDPDGGKVMIFKRTPDK